MVAQAFATAAPAGHARPRSRSTATCQTVLGAAQPAVARRRQSAAHQARGHPGQPGEPEPQGRSARGRRRRAPPEARGREARAGEVAAADPVPASACGAGSRRGRVVRDRVQIVERAGRRARGAAPRPRTGAPAVAQQRLERRFLPRGQRAQVVEAARETRCERRRDVRRRWRRRRVGTVDRPRQHAVHDHAVHARAARAASARASSSVSSMSRGSGAVTSSERRRVALAAAHRPARRAPRSASVRSSMTRDELADLAHEADAGEALEPAQHAGEHHVRQARAGGGQDAASDPSGWRRRASRGAPAGAGARRGSRRRGGRAACRRPAGRSRRSPRDAAPTRRPCTPRCRRACPDRFW